MSFGGRTFFCHEKTWALSLSPLKAGGPAPLEGGESSSCYVTNWVLLGTHTPRHGQAGAGQLSAHASWHGLGRRALEGGGRRQRGGHGQDYPSWSHSELRPFLWASHMQPRACQRNESSVQEGDELSGEGVRPPTSVLFLWAQDDRVESALAGTVRPGAKSQCPSPRRVGFL